MRESDERLIRAMAFTFDRDAFAYEKFNTDGIKLAALASDGIPVGIGGFELSHPGVWNAWVLGTDRWSECGQQVIFRTRQIVRRMLAEGVAHRIQAICLTQDKNACRYLELVGMRFGSVLEMLGSNREDFSMYSVTAQ